MLNSAASTNNNFGVTLEQRLAPSVARAQQLIDVIMQTLRVAAPGIVQSFAVGPPATVVVQLATREFIDQSRGGVVDIKAAAVMLPVLQDVPVLIPNGGGFSFTVPIQAGDECLVVFTDGPLDAWLQNGGVNNNPVSQRRHNLSDAVAIFGLRSTPRGLSGYSTTSAQVRNDAGSVVIDLAASQITVTAPTVEVNSTTTTVNSTNATVNGSSNVTIAGSSSVTIGSNVTIDSKLFLQHKHTGVSVGASTTGPVL